MVFHEKLIFFLFFFCGSTVIRVRYLDFFITLNHTENLKTQLKLFEMIILKWNLYCHLENCFWSKQNCKRCIMLIPEQLLIKLYYSLYL